MSLVIDNECLSVRVSLTLLQKGGLWQSLKLNTNQKILYNFYGFLVFLFVIGSFIIGQLIDLYNVWGNLPLMTADAFLLLTNLVQTIKIINLVCRREIIHSIINNANLALRKASRGKEATNIVKSCNKMTSAQMYVYFLVTFITLVGWAASSENRQLPIRAWYPYDNTVSPAYELSYLHQEIAVFTSAILNVCKDNLVTALIAQCRCRLQLLGLTFRTLCQDMKTNLLPLTPEQEKIVCLRLRRCVEHHQAVLEEVLLIEECFSLPTFAQFTVSLAIICVTAFQIIAQYDHPVRLFSMVTYLLNMTLQVFIYCYHGTLLSVECVGNLLFALSSLGYSGRYPFRDKHAFCDTSFTVVTTGSQSSKIADYAYECPWYLFPVRLRRVLLIVMTRARRLAIISVGLTTLSLASFMAIIKASYSLFTLLQQVDEKK